MMRLIKTIAIVAFCASWRVSLGDALVDTNGCISDSECTEGNTFCNRSSRLCTSCDACIVDGVGEKDVDRPLCFKPCGKCTIDRHCSGDKFCSEGECQLCDGAKDEKYCAKRARECADHNECLSSRSYDGSGFCAHSSEKKRTKCFACALCLPKYSINGECGCTCEDSIQCPAQHFCATDGYKCKAIDCTEHSDCSGSIAKLAYSNYLLPGFCAKAKNTTSRCEPCADCDKESSVDGDCAVCQKCESHVDCPAHAKDQDKPWKAYGRYCTKGKYCSFCDEWYEDSIDSSHCNADVDVSGFPDIVQFGITYARYCSSYFGTQECKTCGLDGIYPSIDGTKPAQCEDETQREPNGESSKPDDGESESPKPDDGESESPECTSTSDCGAGRYCCLTPGDFGTGVLPFHGCMLCEMCSDELHPPIAGGCETNCPSNVEYGMTPSDGVRAKLPPTSGILLAVALCAVAAFAL